MKSPSCRASLFLGLSTLAESAFVEFSNCFGPQKSLTGQTLLQFVPYNVTAFFDITNPSHNLNVTVYGNVQGQETQGVYPAWNDPSWTDPNSTFGKIVELPSGATYNTTLFTTFNVLDYTPYNAGAARFCTSTIHGQCPLAPAFNISSSDIAQLPAITVEHNMSATYAFTEIVASLKVRSGYQDGSYYSCVNAYITPDIGDSIRGLLRYLPLGILIVIGIATISAAMFSPWGTWDIFRWTSNFGRDEDVLRLVTPGFGDCLQYLQFIFFTSSLSLNYPGFFQPVVSRIGWSSLMFNESFVSHGSGTQPVVDGVYQYRDNSVSGLDRMTQLIGMTSPSDAWADMMVWLAIIIGSVAVLTQIGFVFRGSYRKMMRVPAEDLLSKNWYFTIGNVVRIALGYFILPLAALSMYQFVIADLGPIYSIVLAAIIIIGIIAFGIRLVYLFIRTRPRSYLFDDLQTVLAYGPLYNTYCDDAATFALIPILVNFLRGIAIGAVQASGIAQIVLLAISEVCLILTINAFRPYPSATSMNLYHTCFSIIRMITIFLSIAFLPSLNVNSGNRGWIGYIILLIHACVLVFGFFLNAVQTLIEVLARLAGAGGSGRSDAARGGLVKVFGVRQLSKRLPRGDAASRHSMASNAAILSPMEREPKTSHQAQTRSQSVSASSTMLLENAMRNPNRGSQILAATSDGQVTPDAASTFSKHLHRQSGNMSPGGILGLQKQVEAKDPYYRPPRRNTMDLMNDTEKAVVSETNFREDPVEDRGEGSSTPARGEELDEPSNEFAKSKIDYAVREVDFYYGVRGPALSSGTRRLKTGPADPTGPVSSATGWFKGLLGGRKKENSKGFEVVRSARAPPPGLVPPAEAEQEDELEEKEMAEPYRDVPLHREITAEEDDEDESAVADSERYVSEVPARPPSLPLIDSVGGIELPSRVGSESSRRWKRLAKDDDIPALPDVPRRSSKRPHSEDPNEPASRAPVVSALPTDSPSRIRRGSPTLTSGRIPFASAQNSPLKNRHSSDVNSLASSIGHNDVEQENEPPRVATAADSPSIPMYTGHLRHSNSTLGNHTDGDRPNSVGFVREHRASDGLTHPKAATPIREGRSAIIQGPNGENQGPWLSTNARSGSPVNPYGQPGQRSSRFRD